jgi:hypothetical protein
MAPNMDRRNHLFHVKGVKFLLLHDVVVCPSLWVSLKPLPCEGIRVVCRSCNGRVFLLANLFQVLGSNYKTLYKKELSAKRYQGCVNAFLAGIDMSTGVVMLSS